MITAIIQARMGSTRLPGKVMRMVDGKPLMAYQIERLGKSELVDEVIVATTVSPADDGIADFCKKNNIKCFRGNETDVLDRYYRCAVANHASTVVRLTADCPLSDPRIIDQTIRLFQEKNADYAANTVPPETRMFPDGTDVEVFSIDALTRAHKEAKDKKDREHVTFYFWNYNNGFKTVQLRGSKDNSQYRFTVDYPEDLDVVEYIVKEIKRLGLSGTMEEIIGVIDANPQVKEMNSRYYFGAGWDK